MQLFDIQSQSLKLKEGPIADEVYEMCKKNMKTRVFILFLLLTTSGLTHARTTDGRIAFDCPDVPYTKFQFHFTRELIALAVTTEPFNTVSDIYIRTYGTEAGVFDKFVQYYGETLNAKGWQSLQEDNGVLLYILDAPSEQISQPNKMVSGIFAVVESESDVHLLNIVGDIPLHQIRELLTNLSQLGLEIPGLKSLDSSTFRRIEGSAKAMLVPTLFRASGDRPNFFRVGFSMKSDSSKFGLKFSRSHNENLQGDWRYYGHPIEQIHIHSDNKDMIAQISEALQKGPADIEKVLNSLPSQNTPKYKQKLVVRTRERSATISVGDIPDHKNESFMLAKRFQTEKGKRVHEIQIRGHQSAQPYDVRTVLEKGPEEIEKAIKKLPSEISDIEEVRLQIEEKGAHRTAIVTIVEKPLPSRFYFDRTPQIGFNRVTGWELGAGIDSGFRKGQPSSESFSISTPTEFRGDELSRFFGRVGYGFGNKQFYYRVGGRAVWGEPDSWHLGLTTQFHRATSIIAPDLFPFYDHTGTVFLRILGVPDHQNYYLREGIEVALQWRPVRQRHSFKLVLLAESHDSLQKNTDWHFFNWRSKSDVRENPQITPGRMRSAMFKYDFSTRNKYLGWHNTFFVEHSNPTLGSDSQWTRFQTHIRYAYPLGKNQIRVRAVVGSATAPLPIQRQFVMGGIGTLNGYPLYAFAGDTGYLLNTEFLYRVFSFGSNNLSVALLLDGGQVWDFSESQRRFDPKGSVGLGLQFATGIDLFRFNVAKAFDAEQDVQFNWMFFYSF